MSRLRFHASEEDVQRLRPEAEKVPGLATELERARQDLQAAKQKITTLAPEAERVPILERDLEDRIVQHQQVVGRSKRVDQVADFFVRRYTTSPGDIHRWLPLARCSMDLVEGLVVEDDESSWLMLNWWPQSSDGRPIDQVDKTDLVDLVVVAFGRVLEQHIDEETCYLVLLITKDLQSASKAAVEPVLRLAEAFLSLFSRYREDCKELREVLRCLCLFGVWQMVETVRQRWPSAGGCAELSEALRAGFEQVHCPVCFSELVALLGGDKSYFKDWVRGAAESEELSRLVPKDNLMYIEEKDCALLVLPSIQTWVWLVDMGSHTIRLVSMWQGRWPLLKMFRLEATDGDADFDMPVTRSHFNWIAEHFLVR